MFLIVLCFTYVPPLKGQNKPKLYAQKIDTKNGLPSSTVYYLMEDSKGFIWIATDKGVAKYNGYDFEYFNNGDGLTNNNIFKIKEDLNTGLIWFNAFHGGICYYDGQKIHEHPLNEKIKEICGDSWVYTFVIDSVGNFWFTSTNSYTEKDLDYTFYKIPPSKDTIIAISPNTVSAIFLSKKNYFKPFKHQDKLDVLASGSVARLYMNTTVKALEEPNLMDEFLQNGIRKVIQLDDGRMVANSEEELVVFDESKVYHFDNSYWKYGRIHQVQVLNNKIFVCTQEGAKMLDENYQIKQSFFDDYSISHALKDQDGNYWFSTMNNGVFVASTLELEQYFLDEVVLKAEIGIDSSIWVSTREQGLYKFWYNPDLNAFDCKIVAINMKETGSTTRMGTKSFTLSSKNEIKGREDSMIIRSLRVLDNVKTLKWSNNNLLMVGYAHGFSIYSDLKGSNVFNSEDIGFTEWVKALLHDSKNQFWIGTANGLYLFPSLDVEPIYIGALSEQLKASILEVVEIEGGKILIATDGNGLLMIEGERITHLSVNKQLSSTFVNCIFVENDSSIWLGTNQGINHLKGSIEAPKVEYYNTNNGFPINDIRLIRKVRDHLFVGSNKGMTVYNTQTNSIKKAHKTYLHHIEVNNEVLAPKSSYIFDNEESDLVFHFRTIRFNRLHEYYYRLIGIDTTWQKTNINTIQYNELPYGQYRFEVKAKNSPALIVPFIIQPHFTETWWFLILVSLVALGIVMVIIVLIFRRQRRKMLEERRMSDLESKALRSQMNPHFIFNAMNSIQFLIIKNNSKAARKYLSQFSKLMRFVLENSKHNFISLEEEIETLRSYLDLEKLRYGSQVTIHIEIEDNLNANAYKIPPMLVQPILENALMHGLAPKMEAGNLWLMVFTKEEGLFVVVKDDGIGRVAAHEFDAETKFANKTSSAIKNIEERIENINIIYQIALSFHLEDLYENKVAIGTKAIFFIPQAKNEKYKSSNY